MAEERVQRRLAAILSADVVGYSRLMGQDEAGTLARLKNLRAEFLHPKVAEHAGRIVKTTGDGTLIEFPSAVDAVSLAVEVQRGMVERNSGLPDDAQIRFRIGINVGDIIIDEDDIYGNGVNVAARLEAIAEPGGIYISASVHDYVRGRLAVAFEDLGSKSLKNIVEPIHVHRVRLDDGAPESKADHEDLTSSAERPSIAVLPLANMSGDPEQEFFADGLTEDLITTLSYCHSFSVISRNSTFQYKGQSPDIRVVAAHLGVQYVLEGSVRQSGDRVRITAQLIDGATGIHIWADRFDRKLDDIFDLQDELTLIIAAKVEPEFAKAEQRRTARKHPNNLDAWELCQRGVASIDEMTKDGYLRAGEYFERAIELDPSSSRAHSGKAYSLIRIVYEGYSDLPEQRLAEAVVQGKRAIALDGADAVAHFTLSIGLMLSGKLDLAMSAALRAVELNPSHSHAHITVGNALRTAGRPEEGIPHIIRGLELNPDDPRAYIYLYQIADGHLSNRDYVAALEWIGRSFERNFDFMPAQLLHASILGHLERIPEAGAAITECNRIQPGIIDDRGYLRLLRESGDRNHVFEGLRKAGLPE